MFKHKEHQKFEGKAEEFYLCSSALSCDLSHSGHDFAPEAGRLVIQLFFKDSSFYVAVS